MNMQIILGKEIADQVGDKYIVLELDTFKHGSELKTAYAVLDAGAIPLGEMQVIPKRVEHHNKILENYRKQNWDFCEQMIEHCEKRWGGELNSFYADLYARIQNLKGTDLPDGWNGSIQR